MKNRILFIAAILIFGVGSAQAVSIFGANPIVENQIADNAITADKLTDNAVTANDITDNSIPAGKLASVDMPADEECATYEGGNFEWQPCGGGGGSVQEAIINLTASNLRKLATTPVELLPAPGAGKMYVPMAPFTFSFAAGTFPYTFASVDQIVFSDINNTENISDNDTIVQDDYLISNAPTGECTPGETITAAPSGATGEVVASNIQGSGYIVFTNTTGTWDPGNDSFTGGTSGCTGTVDDYVDDTLATADASINNDDGSILDLVNVVGTFTVGGAFGSSPANALATIDSFNEDVPLVGPGIASIVYGANYADRFISQQIEHPTIDSNTDKVIIGLDNNSNVYRSPAFYENKAINLESDFDWTDGSDNDSNGDGTATLYLYYQIVDL